MRCWRCNDRDEYSALGLCHDCRRDLDDEKLTPPGKQLLAPGTLPEEVGPGADGAGLHDRDHVSSIDDILSLIDAGLGSSPEHDYSEDIRHLCWRCQRDDATERFDGACIGCAACRQRMRSCATATTGCGCSTCSRRARELVFPAGS